MAKDWDRLNMKTLAANMKKEDAIAFQEYARDHHTTVGALLRGFVQATLQQDGDGQEKMAGVPRGVCIDGLPHIVSYKNTDRLKREVAAHNPKGLNPDGMLNDILDTYFAFVERVRK